MSGRLAAWSALVKPRIIELLLITTLPAMVMAAGGWPGNGLVSATLAGGFLTAGGANALNNVIDRDIDARMARTRKRPLPSQQISSSEALLLGLVLGVAGVGLLAVATTPLAGALAAGALLFYVLVYTLGLKRSTPQNIVIGGAAGAAPALIGWSAVSGTTTVEAWILFGIVFFWTPPHFWALAIRFREDYAAAGVPMLPAVAGQEAVVTQIVLYSITVVGVSLLLAPVAGLGPIYPAAAIVLGAGLAAAAWRLRGRPDRALGAFRYSNLYLALLFGSIALDVLRAA